MQGAGTLELLAELAVAVLGFSGVVAALGPRASGEWSNLDRVRFRGMVRIAVFVLVLSLLPFPLENAGLSAAQVWGWSSGIGFLLCVLALVSLQVHSLSPRSLWSNPGVSRFALAYAGAALLAAPIILGLNAAGVVLQRTATPYVVALLLLFGVSLAFFLRLLDAVMGEGRTA
jgi:hypothetical protein